MALISVEDPVEGAACLHPCFPVRLPDIQGGSHGGAADTVRDVDEMVWEDVHR